MGGEGNTNCEKINPLYLYLLAIQAMTLPFHSLGTPRTTRASTRT